MLFTAFATAAKSEKYTDFTKCCPFYNVISTECKCKDCKAQVKKCPKKGGKCGSPNWKGDKNCDDNNNNCACDWDGGDCCGEFFALLWLSA